MEDLRRHSEFPSIMTGFNTSETFLSRNRCIYATRPLLVRAVPGDAIIALQVNELKHSEHCSKLHSSGEGGEVSAATVAIFKEIFQIKSRYTTVNLFHSH